MMRSVGLLGMLSLVGCVYVVEEDAKDKEEPVDEVLPGLDVLGNETNDVSNVSLSVVSTSLDGLNVPRDLAFNPDVEGELWVLNRADDSSTIYSAVGTEDQSSRHVIDPYALHFQEEASSIAFGAAMYEGSDYLNFGTCHESINTYNDQGSGDYFMGPTLWSSDPDIYGVSNYEAIEYLTALFGFYTDLGSHLDMLHETPLCMGIAWETDNVYWAFNGHDGAINRVDFQEDHDVGYDDHSDGIIGRYITGEVSRVEDVPSHMVFDQSSAFLYIADTGNRAIKVLDTTSGDRGLALPRMEPGTDHYVQDDALVWTLVDGDDHDLVQPSGLALVDETLFVTDHGTGFIYAFDLEGELIDWLDTGLGEGVLMGIEARAIDDLWLVDAKGDRVLRLQP